MVHSLSLFLAILLQSINRLLAKFLNSSALCDGAYNVVPPSLREAPLTCCKINFDVLLQSYEIEC